MTLVFQHGKCKDSDRIMVCRFDQVILWGLQGTPAWGRRSQGKARSMEDARHIQSAMQYWGYANLAMQYRKGQGKDHGRFCMQWLCRVLRNKIALNAYLQSKKSTFLLRECSHSWIRMASDKKWVVGGRSRSKHQQNQPSHSCSNQDNGIMQNLIYISSQSPCPLSLNNIS